jgi:WD40 repeat protein
MKAEERIPGIVNVWNVESNERVTTLDFSGESTSQLLGLNYDPDHPITFSPGQIDFTAEGDRLLITGSLIPAASGPWAQGAILLWDIRQNQLLDWEEVIPGMGIDFWLTPDRRLMLASGGIVSLGDWSDTRGFDIYDTLIAS